MNLSDWLLASDPAIPWQVLRDLTDAPSALVATERARVAQEGWGARLLALQGADGQWEGGALFPHGKWDRGQLQPWTATANVLIQLQEFGVDPGDEKVWSAVARVRDNRRWEHAGQAFCDGEVEPCINGMVVSLGAYFGQNCRWGRKPTREGAAGGRRMELRSGEWLRSLFFPYHDQSPRRIARA